MQKIIGIGTDKAQYYVAFKVTKCCLYSRCQYCHTQLRLGSYAFDKEGQYGHKFFCVHHYGMQGELRPTSKVTRKMSLKGKENKSPEKKLLSNISGVDLLDRGNTHTLNLDHITLKLSFFPYHICYFPCCSSNG